MHFDLYTHITNLNQKYRGSEVNLIQERPNPSPNYITISHPSTVLLSAPHAVKQFRNGAYKGADVYTGGIVEYLCKSASCNGIIRTFNAGDDPNYYSDGTSGAYKEALCNMIRSNNCHILLDIHGCSDEHNCDIFIGTNHGKNLSGHHESLDKLTEILSAHSIRYAIDEGNFCASISNNISRQAAEKTGITCMQLEISQRYRTNPDLLPDLISALKQFIKELDK